MWPIAVLAVGGVLAAFFMSKRGNPLASWRLGVAYSVLAALVFLALAIIAVVSGHAHGGQEQNSGIANAVLLVPCAIASLAGAAFFWRRRPAAGSPTRTPPGDGEAEDSNDSTRP